MTLFRDRPDAGRQLAQRLDYLRGQDFVVLGLPRGGVPVAFEVANALVAPLDVLVVRKLCVPFRPELAFGSIGENTPRVVSDPIMRTARLSAVDVDVIEREQRAELHSQVYRFRHGRDRIPLAGRIAVIVDDGVETATITKAACQVARVQGARKVMVAVPVGPPDLAETLDGYADEVICLEAPKIFRSVRQAYHDFTPTSDAEVIRLLARAGDTYREAKISNRTNDPGARDAEIRVSAQGSGNSRHSPRNRFVASVLNDARLAALLIGFIGATTGARAALRAAADPRVKTEAVVSLGGRPDPTGTP